MNEEQFKITKLMQDMHITAERWAKAVHESLSLIRRAYEAGNYEVFRSDTDFMDNVFGHRKRA